MSHDKILTQEGKKALEERLEILKVTARTEVAERIKEAREFGDISENAEYDAAKDEQAMIEGEIAEIEATLSSAVVLDGRHDKGIVSLGCKVTIQDDKQKEFTYTIVGTAESDPRNGKISNESPIGGALIGHKKGDTVEVIAPGGRYKIKISKIN